MSDKITAEPKVDSQLDCSVSDTDRLNWLSKNAGALGITPEWEWGKDDGNYRVLKMGEYTDMRAKIDDLMEKQNA